MERSAIEAKTYSSNKMTAVLESPGPAFVVYDIGMNNGDDSAYYLAKGFRVIGIDANPGMCQSCDARFQREIEEGRMTVINVGVGDHVGRETFSVNVEKPAISTFLPQSFEHDTWAPQNWRRVEIDITTASQLIEQYGDPYFIKIDVEFFDRLVLRDLLQQGIRPQHISCEVHHRECFDLLVEMGYQRFRLMPGEQVHQRYANATIRRIDGQFVPFEFKHDASGPFGEDFPAPWLGQKEALRRLLGHGLGWIDVHATR